MKTIAVVAILFWVDIDGCTCGIATVIKAVVAVLLVVVLDVPTSDLADASVTDMSPLSSSMERLGDRKTVACDALFSRPISARH